MFKEEVIWSDCTRIGCILPWRWTRYSLTKEKIIIERGVFNTIEDETRLYRVLDLQLSRTLWQRLFRVGTITIYSSDEVHSLITLKNIKKSQDVKNTISDLVEKGRKENRVVTHESVNS